MTNKYSEIDIIIGIHSYMREVLDALKPIYSGLTASFCRQTMDITHQDSVEKVLGKAIHII